MADAIIPMDLFVAMGEPIAIDLVYADGGHPENIFETALYHKDARLSLHADLAAIVLLAARTLHDNHGWTLILKDGLRPIEAQEAMGKTDIVLQNPQWLEEPRMLSGPGQGGHPRGLAIDVAAVGSDGVPVDMGTVFDTMTAQSARAYSDFAPAILQNRKTLESAMVEAAIKRSLPLLPIPSEWWDFRFPATYQAGFPALSDADLPGPLRMLREPETDTKWEESARALAKTILQSL